MMFGRNKHDCGLNTVTIQIFIDPKEPRNKRFKLKFTNGDSGKGHEYTFEEDDLSTLRNIIDTALQDASKVY